ncbi:MAG: hypothetical protein HYS27_13650 [Deltaproteobacteria bacterium]|nr:hypothetical protein [Deltaproteobacteria bacterium]
MPHGTAVSIGNAATCQLESTSFVGRDRALTDLLLAVERERLTTLWGTAGVGKTRLLRRACAETTARGRVTVVEVTDLVPARDRAALVAAVAQALGISLATVPDAAAVEHVGRALALSGEMLLALDGLEHLLPHADVIATWLERAPSLRVLCTSRTPLALPGERALELEPLSRASGLALFEDRLRALSGEPLPPSEQAAADRIVASVGGLPLGVELVAARAADDGVASVAAALADTLGAAPAATPALMAATVGWAWRALGDGERAALERLAACADAAPCDVAEQVVGGDDAPALVQSLRRRSLAWARHGRHGELRVGVYSSVRDFLAERAPVGGDAGARHAEVVARVVATLETRARADDGAALQALLDDGPNIDLALARAADDATVATLALAATAAAVRRGSQDAHDAALGLGLAAAERAGLDDAALSIVERRAALAEAAGATSAALRSHQAALQLASRLGDPERAAAARARQGWTRFLLGERDGGLRDLDQAIGAAPGGGAALALAHNRRGEALLTTGDTRGLDDLMLAATLAAHTRDRALRTTTLLDLARAYRRLGALELAARRLLEAGAPGRPHGVELRARHQTEQAALARVDGRDDDANALIGEALTTAAACGVPTVLAAAHVVAAELALDSDDTGAALHLAELACAHAKRVEAVAPSLEAQLVRARARRAVGDLSGARAALAAVACGLARHPDREAAGLLAIERALLEGEPDGSAPQLRRDLAAATYALAPLGGRPAALAQAMRALLDPEQADRAALGHAVNEAHDAELRALLALARGEPGDERRFALLRRVAPLRRTPARREMVVGNDGRYYEIDGRRISLARQRSLRLIFLALVDEAERRPGHGLAQPEVLARGWPGEKMRADSGATRVYTSIRRLRRGGLEGVLVTRDDGYLIDPQVAVRRVALA